MTSSSTTSPATPARLDGKALVEKLRTDGPAQVLDVRTAAELKSEQLAGAKHVPLHELEKRIEEVRAMPAPVYILCRSGRRAEKAQETLRAAGIDSGVVVEGGLLAYAEAGGTTVKNESHMSLERQVRIAAGLLVLVGVALGWFVNQGFYALSAFVGAGLVFAGVTDTCGMGMMLAKMPWNRGNCSTCT